MAEAARSGLQLVVRLVPWRAGLASLAVALLLVMLARRMGRSLGERERWALLVPVVLQSAVPFLFTPAGRRYLLVAMVLSVAWHLAGYVRQYRSELTYDQAQWAERWSNRRVLETDEPRVLPYTTGFLSARIVVPAWVEELPPQHCQAVIAHEDAHAAAGHFRWNWVLAVAGDIMFFNTIVRRVIKRLRDQQELIADHLAVADSTLIGRAYARSLVQLYRRFARPGEEQLQASPNPLNCGWATFSGPVLALRIEELLAGTGSRSPVGEPRLRWLLPVYGFLTDVIALGFAGILLFT